MNKWFRRAIPGVAVMCTLSAQALQAQEMKPHGDHNPHHGGIVLMYGMDLHYEIVLSPGGKVQLWLSDSTREDLPAAIVSDVAVEIERSGGKRETVDMAIGDAGESWEGQGAAVKEDGTVLHLAFVFRGDPAVVSFPASALMGEGRERLVQDSSHAAGPPSSRGNGVADRGK
jgi:hypothetical protein